MQKHRLSQVIIKPDSTEAHLERVTVDFKAQTVLVQWLYDDGNAGSQAFTEKDAARIIYAVESGIFDPHTTLPEFLFALCVEVGALPEGSVEGTVDEPVDDDKGPKPVERRGFMDTVRGWMS